MGRVPTNELRGANISAVTEASFWSMVKINWVTGCWEWIGMQSTGLGYGRFKVDGVRYSANRVSYAIAYGLTPKDKYVCHACDNPKCVRPDHLFLGSPADNTKDMGSKGRGAFGGRGGTAILTEEQAKAILVDTRTQQEIADSYGISKSTVGKLKTGTNWKHLRTPHDRQ